MLKRTLEHGHSLTIGDDIRITNTGQRSKLEIQAPKDAKIKSFDEFGYPHRSSDRNADKKAQSLSPDDQQKLKINQLKG